MADGYNAFRDYSDSSGDHAALSFLVKMMTNRIATTTLVQIVKVYSAGELAPVGVVDVLPMIHQVDSEMNPTPHGVIHSVPYFRMQGGVNAVIMDPVVDDIGIAVFCSRDIKQTTRTRQPSAPASRLVFSWSDALYIGGVLNGVPSQYLMFNSTGITAVSPTAIKLVAPNIEVDGVFTVNGDVHMTGLVTSNGHDVSSTHRHLASGGTGVGGIPQ